MTGQAKGRKGKGPDRPLDAREELFVAEYLTDMKAERAALAAGYSATVAHTKAFQWVRSGKTKPHVFAAVRARQAQLVKKLEITQERVLKELAKIAFSDLRKFYRADGTLKRPDELDDDAAGALAAIDIDEIFEGSGKDRVKVGETSKIKLWDKKGGIELAMRHLGMLKDVSEVRMVTVGVRDFTGKKAQAGG